MTAMHWFGTLGLAGVGAGFLGMGLQLRKQRKHWILVSLGGAAMLVLVALSLLFGFSL